jgi:hypothetical protein
MGDRYKAYPLVDLSKTVKSVLSDSIGDTPIRLDYDPIDQSVQAVNEIFKATIPYVKLYWFAWRYFILSPLQVLLPTVWCIGIQNRPL